MYNWLVIASGQKARFYHENVRNVLQFCAQHKRVHKQTVCDEEIRGLLEQICMLKKQATVYGRYSEDNVQTVSM